MNVLYNILLYGVWFLSTYYVILLLLLLFTGKDSIYEKKKFNYKKHPKVSVIISAYNEEDKIGESIESLKKIDYDNIEFIIINDGSRDGTSAEVRRSIRHDDRFSFIDRAENRGKAASLNQGITKARGEFIVTMDADSVVEKKIFYKVLPYFEKKDVGAVTVSVYVKNPKSILHKIFELEYIIGLSLFLKIFSKMDAVYVTPGPFSIYRRSMLNEIGGFDEKNITEDLEIAYRIQKKGYKIDNCMDARVYTILPPTFKKICIQRKRWYSGAVYTLYKHRKMLLNSKYGAFGYMIFFNYMLIFLGLILFGTSLYLGASKLVDNVIYYNYINFDIWTGIHNMRLDLLTMGRTSLLGILSLMFTISTLIIGLIFTKTNYKGKKVGILGFTFLFILYQLFWSIALFAVLTGQRVKWR